MVRATSTVAIVAVALSATSTLAVPNHNDLLAARGEDTLVERGLFSFWKNKSTGKKSVTTTPAAATAKGAAMPTVTRHRRAKPTACEDGERPSWDKVHKIPIHRSSSPNQSHNYKRSHHEARAESAAPNSLKARTNSAPASHITPAPSAGAHSGKDKVLSTRTTQGKDGHKTVVHVLPPTRTRCYATTPTGHSENGEGEHHGHHEVDNQHQHMLAARAIDVIAEYINQLD